ncbi:MAG: cupin domain-containing protein [Armatimonadetes bacterium]|nr:cupin domain-containing protein [Armatimonadota bacterium]
MSICTFPGETGLQVLGVMVDILLDSSCTGNQYSVYRCTVGKEVGPPPHFHAQFDEGFTVLSGRVGVLHDGFWRTLGIGESVFVPRGEVHTFRGESEEPAVFIGIATPAGHEEFFRDMDALKEPSQDAIIAILVKHGIEPAI